MSEPLADPTTSPKDPITVSDTSGEPSSEKAIRNGRGVAIPHFIAAYKLASDFMPRDEVGYYLTVSIYLCVQLKTGILQTSGWSSYSLTTLIAEMHIKGALNS